MSAFDMKGTIDIHVHAGPDGQALPLAGGGDAQAVGAPVLGVAKTQKTTIAG